MFRPLPDTPLFRRGLVRQVTATLLIVAFVVGVLLVISLEHQNFVVTGLTEGRGASSEIDAAVGQSRRDLIAIAFLLFLVGGIGIATVVTYLHYTNTRRNLEEVKELARQILESIPTGVLTVSQNGFVTAVNPTAEAILERPANSLLGKPYHSVFAKGHPLHQLFALALRPERSVGAKDIPLESQHGEVRTIRISNAVLAGEGGKPSGVIFQLHDVTEWLAMEKQVNEAQRLEALHTLSAGVAHELRNPLSALILNFHLLKDELQETAGHSKKTGEYLHVLDVELHRLSLILDNMMSYTQSQTTEPTAVDIRTLVSHVAQLLQHDATSRKQELQVSVPTDLPCVRGDETQITQALINVVINAFQAMPHGGICQIVVREQEIQGRQWIEIAVHDTGIGINPSNLAHIFDPFFTTKPNGTGLGLAIAYRILSNHGGRIDVAAPSGGGTSVLMSMPTIASSSSLAVGEL